MEPEGKISGNYLILKMLSDIRNSIVFNDVVCGNKEPAAHRLRDEGLTF